MANSTVPALWNVDPVLIHTGQVLIQDRGLDSEPTGRRQTHPGRNGEKSKSSHRRRLSDCLLHSKAFQLVLLLGASRITLIQGARERFVLALLLC